MSGQATAAGKGTQMPRPAPASPPPSAPMSAPWPPIRWPRRPAASSWTPWNAPRAARGRARDIARAVRDTPLNRYPSADLSALRQAVRAAFGVPDAAGLLFGNGSDELIHIAIQACCAPGDVVLSPGRPSSISTWRRASTTPASSACR